MCSRHTVLVAKIILIEKTCFNNSNNLHWFGKLKKGFHTAFQKKNINLQNSSGNTSLNNVYKNSISNRDIEMEYIKNVFVSFFASFLFFSL